MKNNLRQHLPLIAALSAYLLAGGLLLPYYRYQLNPDCFSYLNNARLLLQGRFLESVSDHWNPLISWLLAPLLKMGMEDFLAAKVMNLLVGVASFFLLRIWLDRFRIDGWMRWLAFGVLAPVILWMAIAVFTPDLQIALALWFYLTILFQRDYFTRPRQAVALGLTAGLAYLAKYYALPFIAVHLLVYHAMEYYRRNGAAHRRIVRQYVVTMTIFLAVFFSWAELQSLKYGHISLGHHYSGYLLSILNPKYSTMPTDRAGLIAPPHDGATSIWDDPRYLSVERWAPWQSPQHFIQYLNILRQYFSILLGLFAQFSPFAMALLLLYLYYAFNRRSAPLSSLEAWRWLLPLIIYVSGYLLVWVEERYLWLVNIWLLLMLLRMIVAHGERIQKDALARVIVGILLLSFVYFPFEKLGNYIYRDREHYDLAVRVAQWVDGPGKNTASNKNWQESLFLSYRRHWRYYGSCAAYAEEDTLKAALEKNQIDYFLYWGGVLTSRFEFLNDCPEMTGGRISGLRIYDLASLKPIHQR